MLQMKIQNERRPKIGPFDTPGSILHHSLKMLHLPFGIGPTNTSEQILLHVKRSHTLLVCQVINCNEAHETF